MPRTIQADGRTITVPDDATPEEVNQIVGPAPKAGSTPTAGLGWRDKLLSYSRPLSTQERQQITSKLGNLPGNAMIGVGNTALGAENAAGNIALHPYDTARNTLQMFADMLNQAAPAWGLNSPSQQAAQQAGHNRLKAQWDQIKENPDYTLGTLFGGAETGKWADSYAEPATAFVKDVGGAMKDVGTDIKSVPLRTAKIVTGTGPRSTGDLVRSIQTENAASESNATSSLKDYNRDIGKTIQSNKQVELGKTTRAQSAADLQVKGSQMMTGLKDLEKQVRGVANDKYGVVRAKVGADTVPRAPVADDLSTIERQWLPSPEKVAAFKAILSGDVESPNIALADQTAKNLGYKNFQEAIRNPAMKDTLSRALPSDVFQEALSGQGGDLNWNDLQRMYERTGTALGRGGLPSDMFNALRDGHAAVGKWMQQLSSRHAALNDWYDARDYYRDFMGTFHDATGPNGSGSPIAQALDAKDTLHAAAPFLGKSGDRAVGMLGKYSPDLAKTAQDLRNARAAYLSAPKGTRKLLPPRPDSATYTPRDISPEDIAARKIENLQTTSSRTGNIGQRALDWRTVSAGGAAIAMLGEFKGFAPALIAGGTAVAAPLLMDAISRFLERPGVSAKLATITPADLARIPPELRSQALRDLYPILAVAKTKGIQINPVVMSFAGAIGAGAQGGRQSNQHAPSSPAFSPAQAFQAMQPAQPQGVSQ